MMQKFTAMLAAVAFAAASFTPVTASAQNRHGGWDRGGGNCQNDGRSNNCGRDRGHRGRNCQEDGWAYSCDRYGRYRDRDDDDDAVAAGVIGLVLGAVLATAVTNGGNNRGYDDDYDSREAYEREYGEPDDDYYGERCMQQVRRWDPEMGRYVIVDVPC